MERQIGVGPHPKPWPTGECYDPELLEQGDDRNVADKYRYWTVEAIRRDLTQQNTRLEIAIENWQHDFNIGTIVRNANAFGVTKVHIIGKRHWNRRGAMKTEAYLDVQSHPTVGDFAQTVAGKTIIGVDNRPGARNLSEVDLPQNVVLVFGGEGPGLSDEMITVSEHLVQIEQFGSTRSVNVGVASGILLYKWAERYKISKIH